MVPLNSKLKYILFKLGYMVCWSLALLYATFPELFEGVMTFDFHQKTLDEANDIYIFPVIMSMILFVIDVIFGYLKDKIEGKDINIINVIVFLSLLLFFLYGFVLSIRVNSPRTSFICFIMSWTCLSLMKLLKPDLYDIKSENEGQGDDLE